jgi:hypothetical protein
MHGIADESSMRRLCELFYGARVDAVMTFSGRDRECIGHGRRHDVYQQFDLHWGEGRQKLPVYCELLRRMMADQLAWIRDRGHVRRVTEQNGRDALAMACAAERRSRGGEGETGRGGEVHPEDFSPSPKRPSISSPDN